MEYYAEDIIITAIDLCRCLDANSLEDISWMTKQDYDLNRSCEIRNRALFKVYQAIRAQRFIEPRMFDMAFMQGRLTEFVESQMTDFPIRSVKQLWNHLKTQGGIRRNVVLL